MPNYKQIESLIAQRKPFKHGDSMSARVMGDVYEILSYSTLIATYDLRRGEWWINPNKYSVTTSKQQNLIRRVVSLAA